jgi:hypothetical protein
MLDSNHMEMFLTHLLNLERKQMTPTQCSKAVIQRFILNRKPEEVKTNYNFTKIQTDGIRYMIESSQRQ